MAKKSIELPDGSWSDVVVLVDTTGAPLSGLGGGGGGGGSTDITTLTKAAQLPATIGQKNAASSLSVVLSSDGPFASNFGVQADTAAATDTGNASYISLFKRMLQRLTTLLPQTSVGGLGALAVSVLSQQAGERNIGSSGNSYMVQRHESNGTIATGVTSAIAISAGQPAHLFSAMPVNAALTGTCTITGLTDQAGTAVSMVLPIGTAAFSPIGFGAVRCETSITVTLSVATDKVLINWRPI